MAKMLIVDDEQNIREIIREYAEFEGYETDETDDGMKAVRMAREENYDLIIMDVMMPKLDGYSAVKEIRKFSDVPVIILSARVEEYDKLFGFEIGVDDYVTKPFSPKELIENNGIAISREKLLSNVWGYDFYGDDRTVDTHIKMLRSSLGKYRDKIVTLRGLGYKIEL